MPTLGPPWLRHVMDYALPSAGAAGAIALTPLAVAVWLELIRV